MVNPVAKTGLLFGVIIALFVFIGAVIGEYLFGSFLLGLIIAFALSLVLNLVSYFFCVRFVLWSTGAKIVTPAEAPRLARIVDELAPQFGLVRPRLAIVPTQSPNAFATGRNAHHAVVAATEGILRLCNDRELRGVLAHELAHVKDQDILVMTFAATLAGAISYIAQYFLFSQLFGGGNRNGNGNLGILAIVGAIAAPIAAMLLQLAISRSRELHADEVGAKTIHDPLALASALEKLEHVNEQAPAPLGNVATSALLIVNPLRGSFWVSMFSTHPPLEERVRRLRAMASDYRYSPRISGPSVGPFTAAGARPSR